MSSASKQCFNNQQEMKKLPLYLDEESVRFEPVSQKVSIFFDEYNHEIITTRKDNRNLRDDTVEINFQNAINTNWRLTLNLPTRKRVISIKFNPGHSILAYQTGQDSIEFRNVHYKLVGGQDIYTLDPNLSYRQSVSYKNSSILGYIWTNDCDIVIVTNLSIEYYHVKRDKQSLDSVKIFSSSTNWFVFQPGIDHQKQTISEGPILMVSTSSSGSVIQPYKFNLRQIVRLTKFEVEGPWQRMDNDSSSPLLEKNVTISTIYGKIRLLVLQHEMLNKNSTGAQVLIYTIDSRSGQTTKTHILDLNMNGRFAINILDDLIIVHDQPSKTSLLYDIELYQTEKNNLLNHYKSVLDARPIMGQHSESAPSSSTETISINPDLYSISWVFFQPNYIIDAKRGLLWRLKIDLNVMIESVSDQDLLLDFLALRRKAKYHIIKKCRKLAQETCRWSTTGLAIENNLNPLEEMSNIFEKLSHMTIAENDNQRGDVARQSMSPQPQSTASSSPVNTSARDTSRDLLPFKAISTINNYKVKIDQLDVYHGVLQQFDGEEKYQTSECVRFVSSLILEYIFSLKRYHKLVDYAIYKQLIDCLVRGGQFYQLHQLIVAKVFTDSKQLSCLLLSLSSIFPDFVQLGLDMLSRLSTANEEIVDVLLSQNQLMKALHFLEANGNVDTVSARQFFANALETGDHNLFYNIFRYFEYRNIRLRGSPAFVEGEQCEQYVKKFCEMFGSTSS